MGSDRILDRWAHWVVAGAIYLNFVLAVINAQAFGVSEGLVMIAQIGVLAAAAALVVARPQGLNLKVVAPVGLMIIAIAIAGFQSATVNPRFLHDVLIIPLFVALGASLKQISWRFLSWLAASILFVGLVERFLPALYISIVNPVKYYASTRSWAAATVLQSGMTEGLYMGAARTGGNYLGGAAAHRVASVFLEPISFAYFGVLFYLFASSSLRFQGKKIGLFVLCAACCLLADTRTALMLLTLLAVGAPILSRVDRRLAAVWPVALAIFIAAIYPVLPPGELRYRLSLTVEPLARTDLWGWVLGGGIDMSRVGDSGIIYLIGNAGILGCAALYAVVVSRGHDRNTTYLAHALGNFFAFMAMFGGAFLSIKTAAFAGFMLGAMSVATAGGQNARPAPARMNRRAFALRT